MARSFNGSTQYANVVAAPVSGVPLSISAWIYPTAAGAIRDVVLLNSASDKFFGILLTATERADVYTWNGGSNASATVASGMTLNAWNFVGGVWSATNSRKAYQNTLTATNGSTVSDPVVTQFSVAQPIVTNAFEGRIAHVAIWNAALTDDEMSSLQKGFSPLLVRPSALRGYWPLQGNNSPELDLCSTNALTLTASPTKADDPAPLYLPQGRL